jgi:hypothetical protein
MQTAAMTPACTTIETTVNERRMIGLLCSVVSNMTLLSDDRLSTHGRLDPARRGKFR